MIRFLPDRFFNKIPRWMELLLYLIPQLLLFDLVVFLKEIIGGNNSDIGLIICLSSIIYIILFLIYKVHRTFKIANSILIDYENKLILIEYSFLYIIKRFESIRFNDFTFKYQDIIGYKNFSISSNYDRNGNNYSFLAITIYSRSKRVIRIVSRNGWKKEMLDEIIEELNKISPTSISNYGIM